MGQVLCLLEGEVPPFHLEPRAAHHPSAHPDLGRQDAAQLRTATEELSRASHKLAEAVYAKASAQQGAPDGGPAPDGDGQPSKGKEDVVEAEFEEVKE